MEYDDDNDDSDDDDDDDNDDDDDKDDDDDDNDDGDDDDDKDDDDDEVVDRSVVTHMTTVQRNMVVTIRILIGPMDALFAFAVAFANDCFFFSTVFHLPINVN